MRIISRSIFLLLVLAGASPVHSWKVQIDYDGKTDFSRLKTFNWAQQKLKPDTHPLRQGSPLDLQIRGGLERELMAKGFVKAEAAEADFLLVYEGGLADQFRVAGGAAGVAPGYSWSDSWGEEMQVHSYGEGHLILDILDPQSNKVLWSAWARAKARTPEQFRNKVDGAVKKLLRKFPPR